MTVVAESTVIGQALTIRAEVMNTRWPPSREAQWAIGWALRELDDVLALRDHLLNGDLDPDKVHAPDMGWWDDPARQALEYVDDQALQWAIGLKRLLDAKLRDAASKGEKAA